MTIGILNCSPYAGYDNRLPREYHFLQRHRKEVTACIGDQVIFYEPGHRGGRQGYFATAKVSKLRAANEKGFGHFYVTLEEFREFPRLVPFLAPSGRYFEEEAISPQGRLHVRSSVRFPSEQTFTASLAELSAASSDLQSATLRISKMSYEASPDEAQCVGVDRLKTAKEHRLDEMVGLAILLVDELNNKGTFGSVPVDDFCEKWSEEHDIAIEVIHAELRKMMRVVHHLKSNPDVCHLLQQE